MKVLWIHSLLFLCLFNSGAAQTRVPRHENTVLIPQSDLIIIGRVQERKYITTESLKETIDTEKDVGELVELVVEDVLLDSANFQESLLAQAIGPMAVQVYVPGRPFGTDREVLFLPEETYLVFLKRYTFEAGKTPPLVMWNRLLKKWGKFPEPSGIYFTVVNGGDGLVPQREKYQSFIEETKRVCSGLRKQVVK